MAISKRLRYEVLRRDGHTCRYCGAKAPDVEMTVDHVVPVALGGKDEPGNLVAACRPCNDGKTSLAPGAPLVAEVAADALRWSQAITAAAGEMLARASGDLDACEHFDKVWRRYGTGPRRRPLPMDPGWQGTVRSLLSAGLPMAVLEECVEIAMGQRKVTEENVFRYMCGVAWKKVREIQDRAKGLVQQSDGSSEEDADGDGDAEDAAIQNWCRIILRQRDPAEVEIAEEECLSRAGDTDPSGVLWFVIHNLELERGSLADTLRDLVTALPGDTGARLIQEHEARWRQRLGPRRPYAGLTSAAQWATEHTGLEKARRELAMLPRCEYEALVQRSMDENADIAEHLSRVLYVTEAAGFYREPLAPATGEEN